MLTLILPTIIIPMVLSKPPRQTAAEPKIVIPEPKGRVGTRKQ